MGRGGAASCLEELSQSQWQLVGRPIKTSNKQLHLHQCGISQMTLQGIQEGGQQKVLLNTVHKQSTGFKKEKSNKYFEC